MKKLILVVFAALVALTLAQDPVCKGYVIGNLGDKCNEAVFPDIGNNTVACRSDLHCSPVTGLCIKSVNYGTDCISDDNCTYPYTCIEGKCSYLKHFGQACEKGAECYSGICTDNKCSANNEGEACSADKECKNDALTFTYLYCKSGKCEPAGAFNETCDFGNAYSCLQGLVCVKVSDDNFRCLPYAKEGEECSADRNEKPTCESGLNCNDGKCEKQKLGKEGDDCTIGDNCEPGLACDEGVCKKEEEVKCTKSSTAGEFKCKSVYNQGYCKCTSHDEEGTCASDLPIFNVCPSERNALTSCLSTKCDYRGFGTAWLLPSDNCGASQCSNEFKAYVCCAKSQGEHLADDIAGAFDCTTPQPSPSAKPSQPQSSQPSSAAAIAVSFILMIATVLVALI